MDGKEKAVMSPTALVYQIVMHWGRATEVSIRRSVLTVLTTRWDLPVNFLVYMATNIHQTALFANVINVTPGWLVTSSALDEDLAGQVVVSVIQDGKVTTVKY